MKTWWLRLRAYVQRNKDVQRWTWKAHVVIHVSASYAGLAAGACFGAARPGFWVATYAVCALYVAKEFVERRKHRRKGDWTTPDASGVDPRSDMVADMGGPLVWTAGVTAGALM